MRECQAGAEAQREHEHGGGGPKRWRTCLGCFEERRRRRRWVGDGDGDIDGVGDGGLERRKAFLCGACAGRLRREVEMGGGLGNRGSRIVVKGECGCRGVVDEVWLCHLHGDEVEGEWKAALANAEAAIIAMGRVGACVACGEGVEDRTSGVWSCKVCRDWVWSAGDAGEAVRGGDGAGAAR